MLAGYLVNQITTAKNKPGNCLSWSDCLKLPRRRIGGFSRGMRQRLGLAQAMMNDPQVLLLDEPVSALDPQGRKEVLEMIAALRGTATVFLSTHILADVERICDQVGIIDHGRLIIQGNRCGIARQIPHGCDPGRA